MKRILLLALAAGAVASVAAPSQAYYCTDRYLKWCLEEDTGQDLQWFCDVTAITEPTLTVLRGC